jgi:hypothetical protein
LKKFGKSKDDSTIAELSKQELRNKDSRTKEEGDIPQTHEEDIIKEKEQKLRENVHRGRFDRFGSQLKRTRSQDFIPETRASRNPKLTREVGDLPFMPPKEKAKKI